MSDILFTEIDKVSPRFFLQPTKKNDTTALAWIYWMKQYLHCQEIRLPLVLVSLIYEYVWDNANVMLVTTYLPIEQSRWYCDELGNCAYPHPRHSPQRRNVIYCSLGRCLCSCFYYFQRCFKCWCCPWFCPLWFVAECSYLYCYRYRHGYYQDASQRLLHTARGRKFWDSFRCSCCRRSHHLPRISKSTHQLGLILQTCNAASSKLQQEMNDNSRCEGSLSRQPFVQVQSDEMDFYAFLKLYGPKQEEMI